MKLNNKVYELLKWLSCIALHALGCFYFTLSETWGLPYGEQVQATLNALGTFIGILIGISTYQYRKENPNGQNS